MSLNARKFIFAMIVVSAFFLITETALRLSGFSFQPLTHHVDFGEHFEARDDVSYVKDATRFWVPKANAHLEAHWLGKQGARTNSLGLRDEEPVKTHAPRSIRVLCLGDSGTFGWGVNDGETYPDYLENYLNEWSKKNGLNPCEVMNAGVCGYSSFQSYQMYLAVEPVIQPHIVTFSAGRNDLPILNVSDPDRRISSRWENQLMDGIARVRTGQLLLYGAMQAHRMREKALKAGGVKNSGVPRVNDEQFIALMENLIRATSKNNQTLIFILRGAHDAHLQSLEREGKLFFMPLNEYRQLGQISLFLSGGHPDSEAYDLIAQELFHVMIQKKILRNLLLRFE